MLNNDLEPEQYVRRQEAAKRDAADRTVHDRFAAERVAAKKDTNKADADKGDRNERNAADRAKGKPPGWRLGHTIGLAFFVALIVVVCLLFPLWASGERVGISLGAWRLATWFLIMALLGGMFVLIGHGITGLLKGFLIDSRNRMTLSRLQQITWTILVLSAFLAIAAFRIRASPNTTALDIVVPMQVWSLLGISVGSLVISGGIKSAKRNSPVEDAVIENELQATKQAMHSASEADSLTSQGLLATKKLPQNANISDLFRGDEIGSAAQLELGKVQMFFFTIIVVLAYAINLGSMFYGAGRLPDELPEFSEGMVILLLISHAGFIASKAIPASPTSRNA